MNIKSFFASLKRVFHPKVNNDLFLSLLIHKTYWDSPLIDSITFTCFNNHLSISNLKIRENASIIEISYTKSMLNYTLSYFYDEYPCFKDQEIHYNRIEQETIHLNFQEEYENKVKEILTKLNFVKNFKSDKPTNITYYLNDGDEAFSFNFNYFNKAKNQEEVSEKYQSRLMALNIKESQIHELNKNLQNLFTNINSGCKYFPKYISSSYFQIHPIVFTRTE